MNVWNAPSGGTDPGSRGERVAFGRGPDVPRLRGPANVLSHGATPPSAEPIGEPRAVRGRWDWAYVGLFAFTGMLFLRPQDLLPPLAALHLAEVFAIVGLAALINGRLARQQPVLPLTQEVVGILLFAGVMLALVPFSIWPGGSLSMMTELYLKVVLIFILMAGTLTTPRRLQRFAWLIVLASAYLGLRGVVDYARGINMVENGRLAGSVGGVFNNPNDLALNMVAFLPIALLLAARRGRPAGRLVAALASVLMFVTIVFTKSRGGFLGLGAMLIVLVAHGGRIRRGFGSAVVVALLAAVPLLPSSFWARMASITDESEDATGSREARRTVMREAWQAFLQRPLTGVGPGEFKDYNPTWRQERWREAHNAYLQVASESGIAGAVVFLSLVWMAVRDAWATSRQRWRRRAAAAAAPGRTGSHAAGGPGGQRAPPDPASAVGVYATAMSASIVGWIVCATFASVAYTWTFYYVFGIAMAARRMAAATPAAASGRFARRRMAA